jgi:phage FluMu protein Com
MAIETTCQGCGQRLRVADEHAGKKARCPHCQAINQIPGRPENASGDDPYAPRPLGNSYNPLPTTPVSAPAPTAAESELWTLQIDDGRTFGPIQRPELDKWFGEGRITPACKLMSSRDNRWRPAGEIYPSLGITQMAVAPTTGVNQFGDRPAYGNPYASPRQAGGRSMYQPHNGVLILVLGIVGLLVCAVTGPIAAILGHQSLAEIRAGRMDPEGQGMIIAGVVLGWIATVPLVLGVCFVGLACLGGALGG